MRVRTPNTEHRTPKTVLSFGLSLLAAALSLSTTSCRRGAADPARGGMVPRLQTPSEPTTRDPATVQDGPTIEILMNISEGLVQWSEQNQLVPALAEKWEVTDGGKTFTFHLRPNARFQNGRPVTAADFVYSINRALNPKTRSE